MTFTTFFTEFTKLECLIFIIILIPTIIALIWGAPWVPTPRERIEKMLKLARVKPGKKVYDIGCGDGRMVHLASRLHGADAVGLELSPLVYSGAKLVQPLHMLRGSRAKIKYRDLNFTNISDADVIMCYLMPNTLKRLRKKFEKELKKGTLIVSYAFEIPEWKPIKREKRNAEKNFAPIMLYEIGKHN